MHVLPWVSFHSEVLALGGVFMAAAHSLLTHKSCDTIKLPPLAIWIILGILILSAQFGFGKIYYFGDLAVYLVYAIAAIFAMTLGFNYDRSEELLDTLSSCILVAGIVTVLALLSQAFDVDVDSQYLNPMPHVRRPGGNMGQPNHAATLVVMAIASAFYLRSRNALTSPFTIFLLFLLLSGLAMTESRSGLLSFLAVSICVAISLWRSKLRAAIKWLGVLVGVQQLLWWLWPPFLTGFWVQNSGGVAQINSLSAMGSNLRLTMWQQISDAIVLRPWLGWGWGQLPKALNAVADNYVVSAPFTYSHNVVLDVAIGFGLPASMLFIAGVAYFGFRCFRSSEVSAAFWGACLVVPIAVHSLFEFPYAYAYFGVPACLLLGQIQRQLGMSALLTFKPLNFGLALCSAITLASVLVWDYISLEEDFRVARFESMRIGSTPESYTPPQIVILTQLRDMALVARIKPSPNMGQTEMVRLREIAQRFPATGFQNRYALALALNNESGESLRQLKVIRAMQGEQTYSDLAIYWHELAATHYPELERVAAIAF